MIAYAIVVKDNQVSESGFSRLCQSSKEVGNKFEIKRFDAVTPDKAMFELNKAMLKWTWPWIGSEQCLKSGLVKSAYQTADPNKRIACFMSHYKLWQQVKEPILILEHDAEFMMPLDMAILDTKYDIIGINDPLRATRKAREYKSLIVSADTTDSVLPIPVIDSWQVPQGLAGNSAYIMNSNGSKNVIDKVKELGAWPNDALMCYQNIPFMGVSTQFYTRVQGLPSLTTQ